MNNGVGWPQGSSLRLWQEKETAFAAGFPEHEAF
jgi:hypothetical protein